jgi:hypothetical protein
MKTLVERYCTITFKVITVPGGGIPESTRLGLCVSAGGTVLQQGQLHHPSYHSVEQRHLRPFSVLIPQPPFCRAETPAAVYSTTDCPGRWHCSTTKTTPPPQPPFCRAETPAAVYSTNCPGRRHCSATKTIPPPQPPFCRAETPAAVYSTTDHPGKWHGSTTSAI